MPNVTPEKWIERANYDLETARTLQQEGRYLYVLFFCQQALEKWLKALILKRSGEFPPRVHQLVRLAEVAGVPIDEEQEDFLRKLSFYYVQTRYPDNIPDPVSISEELTRRTLVATEDLLSWLETLY